MYFFCNVTTVVPHIPKERIYCLRNHNNIECGVIKATSRLTFLNFLETLPKTYFLPTMWPTWLIQVSLNITPRTTAILNALFIDRSVGGAGVCWRLGYGVCRLLLTQFSNTVPLQGLRGACPSLNMLLKLSMKGLSTSQDRARSSWFFWAFFMYHEFVTDDFGRRVSEMLWIYGKKERLNTYRKYSIIIIFFFGFILFSRC